MVLSQQGLENQGRDRVPLIDVSLDSTLSYSIKKILATKVHRVWLVDSEHRPQGVLSLTDVIRLVKH
jgi:predicted transcriptional regulator